MKNTELRDIINSTLVYHELADKLQRWIYISNYTALDIIENSDLLIAHSLQHSLEDEPETLELLRMWIKDYLIEDLIKGTPLQAGGLAALFD